MILDQGEKIHLITRRKFEDDVLRHFLGEIVESNDSIVRAEGYTFVFDAVKNEYMKRADIRIRVISLVDADNVINVIPETSDLERAEYIYTPEKRLIVTDHKHFRLDINEFSSKR